MSHVCFALCKLMRFRSLKKLWSYHNYQHHHYYRRRLVNCADVYFLEVEAVNRSLVLFMIPPAECSVFFREMTSVPRLP